MEGTQNIPAPSRCTIPGGITHAGMETDPAAAPAPNLHGKVFTPPCLGTPSVQHRGKAGQCQGLHRANSFPNSRSSSQSQPGIHALPTDTHQFCWNGVVSLSSSFLQGTARLGHSSVWVEKEGVKCGWFQHLCLKSSQNGSGWKEP